MTPANVYRIARLRAGLSQRELARQIGVPVAYVTAIETQSALKRRIARALNLKTPDDEEATTTTETPAQGE